MNNKDVINSVSTVVSNMLSRKYNLGYAETGMIVTLITLFINYIIELNLFNSKIEAFDLDYILYAVVLFLIGGAYFYRDRFLPNFRKKTVAKIYNIYDIDYFYCYFFNILGVAPENVTRGSLDSQFENYFNAVNKIRYSGKLREYTLPKVGVKINFCDKEYKDNLIIKGHFVLRTEKRSTDVNIAANNYIKTYHTVEYLEINLNKNINFDEYLEYVEERVRKYKFDNVTLKYFKIIDDTENKCHDILLYSGKCSTEEELKKRFIDSYFHREKNRLWEVTRSVMKNTQLYENIGQGASVNYILYGPPGSGKSTFIYRIARALNLNIVSIDISSVKKKKELYKMIQNPQNYMYERYGQYVYGDCIVVLEEIDNAIRRLKEREENKTKIKKYMNGFFKSLYFDDDDDHENIASTEDKKDTGTDKTTDRIVKKEKYSEMKSNYESIEADYTVRDLLDILQGSVSLNRSIIIATTNNFNFVNESCPELVRDGRLTPVYFGYLDRESFQEMCRYHFGKELAEEDLDRLFEGKDELKIPTSSVMEIIKEFKIFNRESINDFYSAIEKKVFI